MGTTKPAPRLFLWALLAAVAGYAVFIGVNFAPVAAGADSSGYMHSARLLTEGRLTMETRTMSEIAPRDPIHTAPLGFRNHRQPDRLEPTYPIGLPLHLAAFFILAGTKWGTLLTGVGASVACVILVYLLCRELGSSPYTAAAFSAALGLSPPFLFCSFTPMSDVLATAWCTAAYLAAFKGRVNWKWAVACGFASSVAILIRSTSFVALLPVPLILWNWRRLLAAAGAGLPGATALLLLQNHLYGHPLASGYGPIFTAFMWESLGPSLASFGTWLPRLFPTGFAAIVLAPLLPWRTHAREIAALFLWFFVLTGFYAFYDHSSQAWWYLRFILPGLPALAVLGSFAIDALADRFSEARRTRIIWAAASLIAATPVLSLVRWERELHVLLLKPYQQLYLDVPEWLAANCPPGSVIAGEIMTGTVYFYTDFPVLRWDQLKAGDFAEYAASFAASGRPVYATLLRHEVDTALKERMPGNWEKLTEIDICTIWRLRPKP